ALGSARSPGDDGAGPGGRAARPEHPAGEPQLQAALDRTGAVRHRHADRDAGLPAARARSHPLGAHCGRGQHGRQRRGLCRTAAGGGARRPAPSAPGGDPQGPRAGPPPPPPPPARPPRSGGRARRPGLARAGDTLFNPAPMAALPLIVADEQLESAWAVSEGRQYAANLIGPPLGGLLYGIGRALPFLVDAVSYGISVLTSHRITGLFASSADPTLRRGLWAEAFDGLKLLWRDSFLRAILIQAPLINFAFTGALFTVILGLRGDGVSAVAIGGVEAVIMTGGILGAVLAPQIGSRLSLRQSILLLTISGALCMLV